MLNEREYDSIEKTNDEYREELNRLFANVHENYKLKWFYVSAKEKLGRSQFAST